MRKSGRRKGSGCKLETLPKHRLSCLPASFLVILPAGVAQALETSKRRLKIFFRRLGWLVRAGSCGRVAPTLAQRPSAKSDSCPCSG